jgi:hypothetical protein
MFFRWMLLIVPALELAGQTQQAVPIQVRPQVVSPPIRDGQVTTVYLAVSAGLKEQHFRRF